MVTDPTTAVPLPHVNAIRPADADGDGDLDVFTLQPSPVYTVGWLENRGGRALGPPDALAYGRYAGIQAADMDGDGDLDVVVEGGFDVTAWIENIGVGDPDADGLDSRDEVCFTRTSTAVADTDGGGVVDGLELQVGRDPLNPADDGDADRDGSPLPLDCDDGNPQIHPGAPEVCANGRDDDCDLLVDEGC